MKRLVPPDDVFIEAWNNAATIDECCLTFSIPRMLAIQFACQLRKKGLGLKKYTCTNTSAVCEECGTIFSTFPSIIKVGGARYCSKQCSNMHASEFATTHGESHSRLHKIWCQMKTRCTCATLRAYEYYGGRGICVCDEWMDSYEAFRDWAMDNGYRYPLEIDRRDTNGHYEPENCRWATRTEQMRNTRKRKNAQTSQYKGVSFDRHNKNWRVQVCVPGKPMHRGSFANEIDAAKYYDKIACQEFGEFAHLNFKEDESCFASEENQENES